MSGSGGGSRDRKRKANGGQKKLSQETFQDYINNSLIPVRKKGSWYLLTRDELHQQRSHKPALDLELYSSVQPCSSFLSLWKETFLGSKKVKVAETKRTWSDFLEKSVFLIDHILEQVLAELDSEALCASRLVCVRWAYFGAKALQKITTIRLQQRSTYYAQGAIKKPGWSRIQKSYCLTTGKYISLEQLSTCITESAEFPCTSFSFKRKDIKINPITQIFLQDYGPFIKKLEFDGWVRLSDLKQLLFTHAPNLQQLLLKNIDDVVTKGMDYTLSNKRLTRHTTSRCLDETFDGPQQPTLQKLKVFTCSKYFPQEFVQQILEWSPNLIEVWLPIENLHILVKPVNRLHLLKTLRADIDDKIIKPLEWVAIHYQNNLALSRIQFKLYLRNKDLYPRAVDVVSNILKGSSETCQNLTLKSTLEFTIPRMPAVKHLTFKGLQRNHSPVNLLQRWINLAETFPNLISLTIRIGRFIPLIEIDSIFGKIVPGQITSVKNVYLNGRDYQKIVVQRFKQMFPNATVHTRRVGRKRYSDGRSGYRPVLS